jgi:uncharacterized protein Usg
LPHRQHAAPSTESSKQANAEVTAEYEENASVGERHWQKENKLVSLDFSRQLAGYGLTTAHILYRRPDHPWLLQSYVWQEYDLHPDFPVLNRFLGFWREKLEARLHSVTVAHSRLIKPAEITAIDGIFRLH